MRDTVYFTLPTYRYNNDQSRIAFNLVSLFHQEHPYSIFLLRSMGCEQLSIQYLCSIRNTMKATFTASLVVVNSFQFSIFVPSGTPVIAYNACKCSCEQLSIQYLCSIRNTTNSLKSACRHVVNSFQFSIFVPSGTPNSRRSASMIRL